MGLLNKLTNQGSTLSDFNGSTPQTPDLQASRLHKTYSINGQPNIAGKPQPSNLDLDGETPPRYLDNLPS